MKMSSTLGDSRKNSAFFSISAQFFCSEIHNRKNEEFTRGTICALKACLPLVGKCLSEPHSHSYSLSPVNSCFSRRYACRISVTLDRTRVASWRGSLSDYVSYRIRIRLVTRGKPVYKRKLSLLLNQATFPPFWNVTRIIARLCRHQWKEEHTFSLFSL